MSTIEKFERDCAYCHQPIRLKWKKGLIPPEGVCLVADQVFHDECECWDKYWAKYDRKLTLPEASVISHADNRL
jgi:hypothetical protein